MKLKNLVQHLRKNDSITVRIKRPNDWKPDFNLTKQVLNIPPFDELECLAASNTHLVVNIDRSLLERQIAIGKGDTEIDTPESDFIEFKQEEIIDEEKEKRFPTLDEFAKM